MNLQNNLKSNIKKIMINSFFLYVIIVNRFNIKKILIDIKGYNLIKKKELFDSKFYLGNIEFIGEFKFNPLLHYMYYGGFEKKDPNPHFSSYFYLKNYKDVKISKLNPLIHYVLYGLNEGRIPNIVKDAQQKYEYIIDQNRERVNIIEFGENSPLVSIIILNRNGLSHLKRLFKNFKENIQYPNYEVIIIDNGSSDDSVKFLKDIKDIPIRIVENKNNESFSSANNKGVKIANGNFVLLLNNDIETTYGWLNEMMQTSLRNDHNGTVGAKLIYPFLFTKNKKKKPFTIQHIGIAFMELSNGIVEAYNTGNKLDPFDEKAEDESVRGGVTAAALLVKKSIFEELGGLNENYNYGHEDVDFCLKIIKNGYKNIYCPNALLFHHEHGTDESINDSLEQIYRVQLNRTILFYEWQRYLIKNIINQKLNKEKILSENPLEITFISKKGRFDIQKELSALVNDINNYGWKAKVIKMEDKNVYILNRSIDILISTIPNYYTQEIAEVKKSLIKFGLILDSPEEWCKNPAIAEYDLILTPKKEIHDYLLGNSVESMLISTKQNDFVQFIKKYIPTLTEKYISKYNH